MGSVVAAFIAPITLTIGMEVLYDCQQNHLNGFSAAQRYEQLP